MDAVRSLCAAKALPWIVDPKPEHKALYRGATLMTPNTKETSELAQRSAKSDPEVAEAGRAILAELGLHAPWSQVAETRPLTARNYTMLWAALCMCGAVYFVFRGSA